MHRKRAYDMPAVRPALRAERASAGLEEAEFFRGVAERGARFTAVTFFRRGEFASVLQVFQCGLQFAQHGFSAADLFINLAGGAICSRRFQFQSGCAHR